MCGVKKKTFFSGGNPNIFIQPNVRPWPLWKISTNGLVFTLKSEIYADKNKAVTNHCKACDKPYHPDSTSWSNVTLLPTVQYILTQQEKKKIAYP